MDRARYALSLTDSLFINGIKHLMDRGILVVGKQGDRLNVKSLQQLVWNITEETQPATTTALEDEFTALRCPFDPSTVSRTLEINPVRAVTPCSCCA